LGILQFSSVSTGSLLQHVHTLFSHNEPITTFSQHESDETTLVVTIKTRLLGSKV